MQAKKKEKNSNKQATNIQRNRQYTAIILWVVVLILSIWVIVSNQHTTTLLPNSPQKIDAQLCTQYLIRAQQNECYDTLSKYNNDPNLCSFLVPDEYYDQTPENCALQLQHSTTYAKGILTNPQFAEIFAGNPTKETIDAYNEKIKQIKELEQCPKHNLCINMPKPNQHSILVCLCIH